MPWDRLEHLLAEVIELPASQREAALDRACDGDAALRAELDELIAAHDRPGILDRPLVHRESGDASRGARVGPGAIVSHYEIGEPLGHGGMGVVFRARDLRLGRTVALKFLPASRQVDAHAKARFLVEARAAAAIEHVNVCTVHEIGETDEGELFIAMAYVEGESLRRVMDAGRLAVPEAVRIARQVAAALECAHRHGVVHRDVKPANVMLTRDGTVKLVDFGIAKLEGSTLTGAGATPGTTAYMSPEQVRSEDVDHRTDLWSLGVLFHEMLAGRRPFVGDSDAVTLHAIATATPPRLGTLVPDLPTAIEDVAARALTKDRAQRFQSARAFDAALHAAVGGTVPFVRRRGFLLVAGIAAAVLILVGGLAWWGKVGRAGTLIGDDVLAENDLVLVSEFQNRTADASLAATVTDAIRVELQQSRAVRVLSHAAMWAGLARMQLDRGTSLPQPRVHELAEREGAKAFVVGDIARLGTGYQLTARVIATQDGTEALTARATAASDDVLIDAVEQVGRQLRRGIGESLRSVMDTPPLAQVTTASLPALRAYTGAHRAEREGQRESAIALAKQALAIDSAFASAWDLLYVTYANSGAVRLAADAAQRAYALRERLPEIERLRIEAFYHGTRGEHREEEALWALLAARGGGDVNYTNLLMSTGRLAEAEAMARRAIVSMPQATASYWNLAEVQVAQQRFDAADSTYALMRERLPESAYRYWLAVSLPYGRRDFDSVEAYVRSAEGARVPTRESYQCLVDVQRGRIRAWRRCPEPQVWVRRPYLALAQFRLTGDTTWARAGYERFLAATPDERNPDDYAATIALLAELGRVREARSLLDAWRTRTGVPDPGFRADSAQAVGAIAAAEGRWDDAVKAFLAWNASRDASAYHYYNRGLPEAAMILRRRGQPDSSIALLERALAMPSISGGGLYEAGWYAQALMTLGELYEARGDRERAVRYYQRYVTVLQDADAPIATQVGEVRERLRRLLAGR